MSKMSTLNLELQEQANELGFSTVQEALDNGYEVIQRTMGAPRDLDEIDREPEVWYELQKKDKSKEARKEKLKKEIETNLRAEGYPIRLDGLKHYDTLMEKLWLPDSELEEAHEAWLKEKEEVLKELHSLLQFNKDGANTNYELAYMLEKSSDKIKHAIEFLEKGEV